MTHFSYRQFIALVLLLIIISGLLLCKTIHDQDLAKQRLATLLTIHTAQDKNGPLELTRQGRLNDGGYVVPTKALIRSDLLMGYGIANDPSFELAYTETYHKPALGFDCGIQNVDAQNDLFTFIPECIGNDKFLYLNQTSSKQISSYSQQIQRFHLEGKQVFIKMDIEGAEYQAFSSILLNASHVTGIVLELHFDAHTLSKAIRLLSDLTQDFVLVHVHGNNYSHLYFSAKNATGNIPQVIELTYINKSLVTSYPIAKNQSHPLPIDMPNHAKYQDVFFTIHPRCKDHSYIM